MKPNIESMIYDLHGWCPECGGSGMVMRYQPEDCPNLDIHIFIESLRH